MTSTRVTKLAGLALLAGACCWFIVFIGPQWGFLSNGYRPNGILLGASLLGLGLLVATLHDGRSWPTSQRFGFAALLATTALFGVEAYASTGGVSFDPAYGFSVYMLPFVVALLTLAASLRVVESDAALLKTLRLVPSCVLGVTAFLLLIEPDVTWFGMWSSVIRHSFLFAALAIAAHTGYRLAGLPVLSIRSS